jgi:ribonucleotide reductase beta subunit family protein with ferritin-like domain
MLHTRSLCDAIRVCLLGMNARLICQYIEFCLDCLMVTASSSLTRVPLLASLSNQVKTNFFEKCVSEYAESGV